MRVLVFEDDEPIRRMLQVTLQRLGCEVHAYANPGLCPLTHEEPCSCETCRLCADAIISDVNMPGMSGLELVAGLQVHGCRVPRCLLASGSWSESQMEQARQMGCAVIEKPYSLEFILEWVAQCHQTIKPERVLMDWKWDAWATGRNNR